MESRLFRRLLTTLAALLLLACTAFAASSEKVIFSFGEDHGEYPDTDLIFDKAGNLYGTTVQGGDFESGTVFQLTPTAQGWKQNILYSFDGVAHGGQPYKGVTLDSKGNLYGTAVVGGTGGTCVEDGCGVVYKLSNSGGTWTQTVIYNFTGGHDGYGPGAAVTIDKNGSIYGMTPVGGDFGLGVIYQLKPVNGSYKFRVIHTFTGGADGSSGSAGRMMLDAKGNIFGVATTGGTHGAGVAFELSPTQSGNWSFKTLYNFKGQPDAGFPYGGLVMDAKGNLYGTTYYDGANDVGSIYQLSPAASGGWKERVLHSFAGGADGSGSIATLVSDGKGNLFGTTSEGGGSSNCGTIFKLTPGGNGNWKETVVYRFLGSPDSCLAYDGLVSDSSGTLYGTTVHGGGGGDGAVYKFVP